MARAAVLIVSLFSVAVRSFSVWRRVLSADAKAWLDKGWWCGLHDGDCKTPDLHKRGDYSLSQLLADIEACTGSQLRWEIRIYRDGQTGLVGYHC